MVKRSFIFLTLIYFVSIGWVACQPIDTNDEDDPNVFDEGIQPGDSNNQDSSETIDKDINFENCCMKLTGHINYH